MHKILVEKSYGKRQLGRCRHRWEGKTKTDFIVFKFEGGNTGEPIMKEMEMLEKD
jgi:hypothetical protein